VVTTLARRVLLFLRRCWTGEDLTLATGIGGCLLLVAAIWLTETSISTGLRAIGVGEPIATFGGWAFTAAYVVVGLAHDWRALRRRDSRQAARGFMRLVLASIGLEAAARGSGRVIDTDLDALGERRLLWRIDDDGGEPLLVALEVVNSTPDANGSRRVHFIRVPPRTRTCRAAAAWTFGLAVTQYAPSIET
jgi:hypothetical protein